MAFGNYIKVQTRTGEETVVRASLLPFYASQKATITEPTVEEIEAAFPEERANRTRKNEIASIKAEYEAQIATLKEQNRQLEESNRSLKAELSWALEEKRKSETPKAEKTQKRTTKNK